MKVHNVRNFARKAAMAAAVAGSAVAANAAFDAAALKTEIEGSLTPIGVIGGAVLLVVVGVKVFKWIRSAL